MCACTCFAPYLQGRKEGEDVKSENILVYFCSCIFIYSERFLGECAHSSRVFQERGGGEDSESKKVSRQIFIYVHIDFECCLCQCVLLSASRHVYRGREGVEERETKK